MPLFFGALLFGAILLVSGAKGQSILDTALGRTGHLSDSSPSDIATVSPIVADPTLAGGSGLSPGQLRQVGGEVGPITSSAAMQTLIAECNRIADLHLTYVYGGGHAGYPPNGPFDCSGAVSYVLHAAGLLKGPPRTSGLLALWGQPGEGAQFTVCANVAHVFLDFGSVQWGTSHQNPGGGPGWHHRGREGFSLRHYQGL